MHTFTTAPAADSGHVVVEGWRQPTRSVHRAPSYPPPMEFEPSHPRRLAPVAVVGGGGMLRPRLRFGITSTSSTSRLITLSAAAVAAAAVATVAAVGCGEAVVEVAYEEEEGEAKVAATKEEKKIMK